MARIYLTGENQITIESLRDILNGRGYNVFKSRVGDTIQENKILDVNPDIIFWDSDIIESRERVVFNFISESEHTFKSIFVISSRSLSVLGSGLVYGIQGFVHKAGGITDLENCIEALESEERYISPFLAGTLNSNSDEEKRKRKINSELTEREKKIFKLVNTQKTSKEIAGILNISYKTVQNHRHNICQKLGLKGRGSLVELTNLYYS